MEWSKTTSRSRTETGEFQVEGSVGDAMADATMPVNVDMTDLAQGEVVFVLNFDHDTHQL